MLHVGVTYSMSPLLIAALGLFSKTYPKIKVNVSFGTSEELLDRLEANQLDFVLSFKPESVSEHMETMPLFSSMLRFIVHCSHPLAELSSITLKRLSETPLILPGKGFATRKRVDDLCRKHPDGEFIFIVEGVLMYFYEKQVRTFLHHVASRFGGGELWFDVCGTMMSRHGVKPDSLRKHEAQIRSGLSDGHLVEQWEPTLQLIEQANYMKFFRPRWGFFFGQILGRMTRLCYKFSSLLGYRIISK